MGRRKFFSFLGRGGVAAVTLTQLKALTPIESAAEIRPDRQYVFRLHARLQAEQMEALAAQLKSLGLNKSIVIDRNVEIFELEAVDNSPEPRAVSSEQNRSPRDSGLAARD